MQVSKYCNLAMKHIQHARPEGYTQCAVSVYTKPSQETFNAPIPVQGKVIVSRKVFLKEKCVVHPAQTNNQQKSFSYVLVYIQFKFCLML